VHDGLLVNEAVVQVPLRMLNRHGLIAGATGTGKTISLQTIAEQLSDAGGAVFAAGVKGDVSGLAAPGEASGRARCWAGNRVQHALRAFTPDDAKALNAAASTYPISDFYEVEDLLAQMGIGEAAVTILSEDGLPTPVVHTRMRAPASRMGPADDVDRAAKASPLFLKYETRTEAESARERLAARMEEATLPDEPEPELAAPPAPRRRAPAPSSGNVDVLTDFLTSREGKSLQKKVMRGLFGMLRKSL
jgi:uncharacterized protein